MHGPGSRRITNPLDPASSLVEIVAAVVIAVGIVASARLGVFGEIDPRQAAAVVLACGAAWGVIDAGLYLIAVIMDNGRIDRVGAELRAQPGLTAAQRRSLAAGAFESVSVAGPDHLVQPTYDALATALTSPHPRRRLTHQDRSAAGLVVFWVMATTVLVCLPLLVLPTPWAFVAAQVLGALLLFAAGTIWARHTPFRPLVVGLGLAGIGAAMILLTLVLGAV